MIIYRSSTGLGGYPVQSSGNEVNASFHLSSEAVALPPRAAAGLVHREALHFVGLRLQEEGRAANEKTKHELEDMPTQRAPLVLLEPAPKPRG